MTDDAEERRLLFDLFIHESEMVHLRADWFLIFHAILFEAFLSAKQYDVHPLWVGALGTFVSFVWLMVGIRQTWNLKHLTNSIRNNKIMRTELFYRLFDERWKEAPRWYGWARSTPAFSVLFPGACLIVWLVLTSTSIRGRLWQTILVSGLFIVSILLWARIHRGPNLDETTTGLRSGKDEQGPGNKP